MRENPGFLNGIVTTGVIALMLVWAITGLTNGDALWFLRRFDARAEALVVYWESETYTLEPGDEHYEEIMDAFAQGVNHPSGFEWAVGLSSESIAQYREKFQLLEVHFSEPVQIHTRHPYPEASTFLVPLDKTHSHWRRVFPFTGRVDYSSGPLNMSESNFRALYQAIEIAVEARTS
jgi:hypothetical protein